MTVQGWVIRLGFAIAALAPTMARSDTAVPGVLVDAPGSHSELVRISGNHSVVRVARFALWGAPSDPTCVAFTVRVARADCRGGNLDPWVGCRNFGAFAR